MTEPTTATERALMEALRIRRDEGDPRSDWRPVMYQLVDDYLPKIKAEARAAAEAEGMNDQSEARRFAAIAESWLERTPEQSDPGTIATGQAYATLAITRAILAATAQPFDDTDNMCPNCITPWKCNGPHLADQTAAAIKGTA